MPTENQNTNHLPRGLLDLQANHEASTMKRAEDAIILKRALDRDDMARRIDALYSAEKARASQDAAQTPDRLVEAITRKAIANPKTNFPELQHEVENEVVDISDLLALMTPNEDSRWEQYSDAEKEQIAAFRDDPDVRGMLRKHRQLENEFGTIEGLAPVADRVQKWIDDGHAKTLGKYAKLAVMGGMLLTGGAPVAVTMATGMVLRKAVLPLLQKSSEAVRVKAQQMLVEKGIITPEQSEKITTKLDDLTKKITGSKWTKFGLALGAIVAVGAGSSLAMDAFNGDEFGSSFASAWDGAKGAIDSVFGSEAHAGEIGLVETPGEVEAATPVGDDISHPGGGVDRDALAARFEEAGQADIAESLRALDSQQLTMDELKAVAAEQNPALTNIENPEVFLGIISENLNVDLTGVLEAGQTPVVDVDTSPDPASSSAPATPDTFEPVTLESPPSEIVTDIPMDAPVETLTVTHDVVVGDTLSEAIYDAYRAAGVDITDVDLYGPSDLSDHPQGLVGSIAESNGFANPDLIYPGDTISINIETPAPAPITALAPDTAAPNAMAEAMMAQPADMDTTGPNAMAEAQLAQHEAAEALDTGAPNAMADALLAQREAADNVDTGAPNAMADAVLAQRDSVESSAMSETANTERTGSSDTPADGMWKKATIGLATVLAGLGAFAGYKSNQAKRATAATEAPDDADAKEAPLASEANETTAADSNTQSAGSSQPDGMETVEFNDTVVSQFTPAKTPSPSTPAEVTQPAQENQAGKGKEGKPYKWQVDPSVPSEASSSSDLGR